ncbi:hypothetical protein [Nocardia sp. XZ_19_369]|uniref:hypothetical protein n=1 Tax=Nocardia sp. XZ_19_369 TaxID=2769487 RepID=UPI00188FCFEE|nr:hypothetical protein [Nocardia sp. XZ_19_369]
MSDALSGVVFDYSALKAWAFQLPYVQATAWATVRIGNTIVVPTTALTVAQGVIPEQRLDILEVLLNLPHTVIANLDRQAAAALAASLTSRSEADIETELAARHVVHEAVRRGFQCVTHRGDLLRTFDDRVIIDTLP